MKEFKTIKVKKRKRIIKIIFTFFFFFAYVFMFKYCINNKMKKDILDEDLKYIPFNFNDTLSRKVKKIVNEPVLLLNNDIKNVTKKLETKKVSIENKKTENKIDEQLVSKKINDPIIYVYNTHQTENYNGYSVYEAANKLSNMLNNSNINSIFEQQSISVFLQENNLKYYKSYEVSRKYLNEAIKKYPSIKYFIDLHRDSVTKSKSTMTYNNKSYAKILFIVGLDNLSYNANLENSNKLNKIIENKIPGISRGIMEKKGQGVNGVYNQDISENAFLIEVGGSYNTKEEVDNTIDIIYEALIEYIKGTYDKL